MGVGGRARRGAAVALLLFLTFSAAAAAASNPVTQATALRGAGPETRPVTEPQVFDLDTSSTQNNAVASVRESQQDLEEWHSPPAAAAPDAHDPPSPSVGALKGHLDDLAKQIATLERQMQARAAGGHGHTREEMRVTALERNMEREQLVRLQREGEVLKHLADRASRGHVQNATVEEVTRKLEAQRAVRKNRQVNLEHAFDSNRTSTLGSMERDATRAELASTMQQISSLEDQLASQARAQATKSSSIEREVGQLASQLHHSMRRAPAPSSPTSAQIDVLRSQMKSMKNRINVAWQVASLKKEAASMQARVDNLEQENHALRAYVEALGGMKARKTRNSSNKQANSYEVDRKSVV